MKIEKYFICSLFLDVILIIYSLIIEANMLYTIAFVIWIDLIIYAYKDIEHRSMLFAFGIAFFVFLMGRDFLEQFFSYKVEDFSREVQNHAYICMILGLLSIWIFYLCFTSKKNSKKDYIYSQDNSIYNKKVKLISLYLYYSSWIFAMISKIAVSRFVSNNSYSEYYTEYSQYLTGNTALYVISKIEVIMPVALCIYMATMPRKKEFKRPFYCYILYLIVSLGSGQRSTFMLGILMMFVYFVYRNGTTPGEGWFERKYIWWCIIFVPIIAIFGTVFSAWRMGETLVDINYLGAFFDFFYDQGVSSNILKRAFIYKDVIPGNEIYVFEFLHSGVMARLLGIKVYHGNTIEHALYGGSFTHSLGYAVLGDAYLAGRGTGSSYLAELYQDLGYLGVFIGNILYAFILGSISKFKSNKLIWRSLNFTIITQILWAPRGSYSGFLSLILAPTTIATYIGVFGLAKILAVRKKEVY